MPLPSSSSVRVTQTEVVSIRAEIESSILQGTCHDFCRVDDAGLEHVDVLAGVGVVADVSLLLLHFVSNDGTIFAAVGSDLSIGPSRARATI